MHSLLIGQGIIIPVSISECSVILCFVQYLYFIWHKVVNVILVMCAHVVCNQYLWCVGICM